MYVIINHCNFYIHGMTRLYSIILQKVTWDLMLILYQFKAFKPLAVFAQRSTPTFVLTHYHPICYILQN